MQPYLVCGDVGLVMYLYVLCSGSMSSDWQRMWLNTEVQFLLLKVTWCLTGISYEASAYLIASPAKLPISLLIVMRLNVFEVEKKKWCTKSACYAAAWCGACFGQVSAGVGCTTGSRLTTRSSDRLLGQSASGSQPLRLEPQQ